MKVPGGERLRRVSPLQWVRIGLVTAVVVVVVIFGLLLDGCSGVTHLSYATPPDTTAPKAAPTTVPANYTNTRIPRAYGETASAAQVPVGGGKASLSGTVTGPNGPVGGATIQLTRVVGDATGTKTVTAAADGTWAAPGILGGRYRVRAWMAPTFDMATPQIFFLGGTQSMPVSLDLQNFNNQTVNSEASPLATEVGGTITVQVQVAAQTVDTSGFVDYPPTANVPLALNSTGPAIAANPTAITDASGEATFTLSCNSTGTTTGTVSTPTGTTSQLPTLNCEAAYQAPSTTVPSTTTSTTLPGGSTTTSSTSTPPGFP